MKNKIDNVKSVLFVCTGNSCRSPIAEGFLKYLVSDKIKVASAGTSAFEGMTPSIEAIAVMKEHGIDISGYKASHLTKEMLEKYDLILALAHNHKDTILDLKPEIKDKVFLLKEFDNDNYNGNLDVSDPMGRSVAAYRQCADIIKKCIEGLYNAII